MDATGRSLETVPRGRTGVDDQSTQPGAACPAIPARAVAFPLPHALERIAGLQSQYAPSAYVGLWSRLEGFRRQELTQALEDRSVVQATLMRVTIHMVSAGDYRPFAEGIRSGR